ISCLRAEASVMATRERVMPGGPPAGRPTAGRPTGDRLRIASRRQRRILTPEGVELTVELAARGERLAAFLIDLLLLTVCVIVLLLVMFGVLFVGLRSGWLIAVGLIAFFFLRTFYFAIFELHWQGSTPGKRAIGL